MHLNNTDDSDTKEDKITFKSINQLNENELVQEDPLANWGIKLRIIEIAIYLNMVLLFLDYAIELFWIR